MGLSAKVIKLFFTQALVTYASQQILRPGGQPMLFIGLYQQCSSTTTINQHLKNTTSNICQSAIDVSNQNKTRFWNHVLKVQPYRISHLLSPQDFEYQYFSFCTFQEAVEIGLKLKLNKIFHVSNETQSRPTWNRKMITNWQRSSRIIHILVYASSEISHFYEYFFYNSNFAVSFLNTDFKLSAFLSNRNLISHEDSIQTNAQKLFDVLVYRKITKFAVIYVQGSSNIYQLGYKTFFKVIKLPNTPNMSCFL